MMLALLTDISILVEQKRLHGNGNLSHESLNWNKYKFPSYFFARLELIISYGSYSSFSLLKFDCRTVMPTLKAVFEAFR